MNKIIWPIAALIGCVFAYCKGSPQIIRIGQYQWVESRLLSDTGLFIVTRENHPNYRVLSITDDGKGDITLGYGHAGVANSSSSGTFTCQVNSWEGVAMDLSDCLENEICYGLECGDAMCLAPWSGDTLRITGWGWYFDPLWTGTSCNEIHLFIYKEESYEY
jgi:hypothetical protein